MQEKEIKKLFALLYEIRKSTKVLEKKIKDKNPEVPAQPVERSEEPLHGEGPSDMLL